MVSDFWVEGDEKESILAAATKVIDDVSKSPAKYFLDICHDEEGIACKTKPPGATQVIGVLSSEPDEQAAATASSVDPSRNPNPSSSTFMSTQAFEERVPREFSPRRQYRVVFQDVCQAIQGVATWKETFSCLCDILQGEFRLR